MKRQFKTSNTKQRGSSLVEAMVALVVFAVGALGIAAMQTVSLVRGDDTRQRSIAIWKAQELVDRIKATKSTANPDGLVAAYITAISNDNTDDGIGKLVLNDEYPCPATPPTRCDDQNGSNAAACSAAQVVEADIWMVLCEPNTGVVPLGNAVAGSVGLRSLEVALEDTGTEYRLYFEWLNRTTNNNLDADGADSGQQNSDGSARNITTSLCGDDENIDSRLDAYCLRFE
ncbi:MAG: Tfp pilus assembly protein PilV [Arenicella sp.]|jgi:Tfp pilus assembly protein PilV